MASPENLGSLYFSAAAWALEMVGLEMMIGLALSEVRAQASEWQDLPGTLSAIVKGSRPCLLVGVGGLCGIRLAAREGLEMHETDAPGADHACMCSAWTSHGYRMHTAWHRMCITCASHEHHMCIACASHRVRSHRR